MSHPLEDAYKIIAILVVKLGGEVEISRAELDSGQVATIHTGSPDGKIKLVIEKD